MLFKRNDVFAIAILVGMLLLGGSSLLAADAPRYGGTLIYGAATEPSGLDPAITFSTGGQRMASNILETPLRLRDSDGALEPSLAESWKVSEDGLIWVLYLRQGVKFHDGTPFNAEAFVFNVDRQMNPENPYNQYGPWVYWEWLYRNLVVGVKAVNEYTVEIEINAPFAPFLNYLAFPGAFSMSSPTAIKEWEGEYGTRPVGTGRFKFKEWIRGDHITLVANEDHWEGRPYIDQVVTRFIPDNTVRSAALIGGEIDLMLDFGKTAYTVLSAELGIRIILSPPVNISYLAMNIRQKPFDDVLVRLAVQHAINKEEIVEALYGDLGEVSNVPIPRSMTGHHSGIEAYEYDPELSKKLLAAAGYPNGFDTELAIYDAPRGYNPVGSELAEVVQSYLAAVGINAEITVADYTSHIAMTQRREHKMAFYGWNADHLDPDGFIYTFCHSESAEPGGYNMPLYTNLEVDALINRAQVVTDMDVRTELYRRAQEIVNAGAAWLWLSSTTPAFAISPRVQNFIPNPLPVILHFDELWLSD